MNDETIIVMNKKVLRGRGKTLKVKKKLRSYFKFEINCQRYPSASPNTTKMFKKTHDNILYSS